ncbi:hypothetical protein [Dactylosporangium sp. CA-092794]|uniref:hypothetical protein n=1 Tax=Dactylosporangium sp. CA-092794 TaxID=3239929 RepID=UPI003D8C909C
MSLSAVTALSAACGSGAEAGGAASASGGATSATAGAPSSAPASTAPGGAGDAKANTEQVCKAIVDALEPEKAALANVVVELLTANEGGDQAAKTKAKADADALVGRVTKAVNTESVKASDPKFKAALDKLVANFAKLLTPEGVADPEFDKKIDAATADAAAFCPALSS